MGVKLLLLHIPFQQFSIDSSSTLHYTLAVIEFFTYLPHVFLFAIGHMAISYYQPTNGQGLIFRYIY